MKAIQEKINASLKGFFEQSFGEKTVVTAKWGVPIIQIQIDSERENNKYSWIVTFSTETDFFEISSMGYKIEDDLVKPDSTSINSETINFIIENAKMISESVLNPQSEPDSEPSPETN
jgi:hypothetical protein